MRDLFKDRKREVRRCSDRWIARPLPRKATGTGPGRPAGGCQGGGQPVLSGRVTESSLNTFILNF